MKNESIENLSRITNEILQTKYQEAEFAFLAGSIVRGEGTKYSDLDIVVIFADLPCAYRESFYFEDFPVETFVHTPETLNYFFDLDIAEKVPSLPVMVSDGVVVPNETNLSHFLKKLANGILANPPKITDEEIRGFQYWITDLIDDIREPRSKIEIVASGTRLYEALSNCYFRINGMWLAKSKTIPRSLQKHNPDFYKEFTESFEALFVDGKTDKVIKLAEATLQPHGGFLFDGVKINAPKEWRKPIK